MRTTRHNKIMLAALAIGLVLGGRTYAQQSAPTAWSEVEKALGRAGEEKDGVYRVAFPRTDLRVRVGGVTLRPGLALTSWAAFLRAGNATMVMGDLVLLGAEVTPAVSALSQAGIEITALHNHIVGEQPRVMYLHFHGHGDAARIAAALRDALAKTTTPLGAPPSTVSTAQPPTTPDADLLSKILGRTGTARGGVVSFSIPRAEKITASGATLGPRMGVATAINFQVEGSGAVSTGDFVLLAGEVQPVIAALRQHGIEVTALHNHMLDEQPRLFFLHFWGHGDSAKLAQGLRAALDRTQHVSGS